MHNVHKKIPAIVSSIQEVGKDSKELFFTFEHPVDFSYDPGQFIMLEIPEPRQDSEWKIVTPREVWDVIAEKEKLSLPSLIVLFPDLEEKTLEGIIHKLTTASHISEEDGVYHVNKENPPESKAPIFQRAYSMASCPTGEQTISTMVKATPNGFMSKYLIERLSIGEKVLISGPLGKFSFQEHIAPNVLLISAGSGITPLMSILRYIAATNTETNATLLYSNKTPESIIYQQELATLQEKSSNIEIIHTITRPEESESAWSGETGRIDLEKVRRALEGKSTADTAAFICGPLVFGKSMKDLLIEAGLSADSIHMEAYG